MAQNEHINKVVYNGNTLIDLTQITVASNELIDGVISHNAAGEPIVGSFSGYNPNSIRITVVTSPQKTNYIVGDTFDLSGIKVNAELENGFAKDVTEFCQFDPYNGEILEKTYNSLSIVYKNGTQVLETTDTISVTNNLVSISVTEPTKTTYTSNQKLDLTGCVVTALYENGDTKNVTSECVFNPANGTVLSDVGTKSVTISYTDHDITKTASFSITVEYKAYSWSSGTIAQLKQMLNDHYAGKINISDYWKVGDKRVINLSSSYGGRTSYTMVLTQVGGKTLTNSISGKTTCAFQFDALETTTIAYSRPTSSTSYHTNIYDALPSDFKGLLKQFKELTAANSTTVNTENTYIGFRSEIEVYGTNSHSYPGEGSQISYYANANNRKKTAVSNIAGWWLRSIHKTYNSRNNGYVQWDGTYNYNSTSYALLFYGVV